LICLIRSDDVFKLWSSALCNYLHSSLLGPNILLSTLFLNTLSLCYSLNVRDQFSHPYKTTGRIVVLCILTFMILDSRQEDKKTLNWMVASIPQIYLAVNFFMHTILIC
jgi:predicted branched-subunit amino acid permease